MERNLILDKGDLILVVDKEVIRQIDKSRGAMNRTDKSASMSNRTIF